MVRGQRQKCQLKTPQALGTVSFCVDLTFKSWVASIFTERAEEEAKTIGGEYRGLSADFCVKALDQVAPPTVGTCTAFIALLIQSKFSLSGCFH